MLFALPAAVAVPIVAGILLGGPPLGFLIAAVLALLIVAGASRVGQRAPSSSPAWWRAAALRRFLLPLVVAVVGVVLAVVGSGTVRIIGWGVIAVAITLTISLVFLEVGYSEDRARARGDEDPTRRADGSTRGLRPESRRRPAPGRGADVPPRR